MKTRLRRLALAALLLAGTSMTSAEDAASTAVGDLQGYGEEAYFHEDATYAENAMVSHGAQTPVNAFHSAPPVPAASMVSPRYMAAPTPMTPAPQYTPVAANQLQQTSFLGKSSCDAGCDGSAGCDGGCDSAFGGKSNSLIKLCDIFSRCECDGWATTEFLLWHTADRPMPALVTTSDPGTFPVLPDGGPDNVQTVFGDDIEGEFSGGFRGDFGKYLNDHIGIGGRFWILANNNDSYYNSRTTAPGDSVGRPFFNTQTGGEDVLLVSGPAGGPLGTGPFAGSVAGDSSLNVWGAELYSRLKFTCTRSARLDLLVGYSHFQLDDELNISSTTVTLQQQRYRTYRDLFKSQNRFDGGQVGFEMVLRRGRWTARSLTKVHMGNMQQSSLIVGSSTDVILQAPPSNTSGGLLALGNQGYRERDKFAFIPEANFKLNYCIRKNMSISAGYSFMYFDNVVLSGDLIDRNIDPTALNTGSFGTSPAFKWNDSGTWVQGLDLGLVIDL